MTGVKMKKPLTAKKNGRFIKKYTIGKMPMNLRDKISKGAIIMIMLIKSLKRS
jgi:hypothetical protein